MSIKVSLFGKTRTGQDVDLITLANNRGLSCGLLTYGATVQSLWVPDAAGQTVDVVLGYDTQAEYEKPANPFHGATVGRNANRIMGASFTLSGRTYPLAATEGRNNLHSLPHGLDKVVWDFELMDSGDEPAVKFHYLSPDGESGFPGAMDCSVIFRLTSDQALSIEYLAVADQETIINLTNHAYFNLRGPKNGSILDHRLEIASDYYTPINSELLPDGRLVAVEGTPFDFDQAKPIGQDIKADDQQLVFGTGYDHNFAVRGVTGTLRFCSRVVDPESGRTMTVETTSPGVQLYTGNHLKETGKQGLLYAQNDAFCLETQYFPNALEHKNFEQPIFAAGQKFSHQTIYRFGNLT